MIEVIYDQSLPVRVMVVKKSQIINKQIRFIGDNGKVVGIQQVSGQAGSAIDVKLKLPDGYQQLDTHNLISLKLTDDTPFDVRVTKVNPEEVKITKKINFIDQATGQVINSLVVTKNQGESEKVNLTAPKGYHLVGAAKEITLNFDQNGFINVNVAKDNEHHKDDGHHDDQKQMVFKTIEFVDQNGNVVGKQFVSNLDGTSQTVDLAVPAGYKLINHGGAQLVIHFDANGNNIEVVNVEKIDSQNDSADNHDQTESTDGGQQQMPNKSGISNESGVNGSSTMNNGQTVLTNNNEKPTGYQSVVQASATNGQNADDTSSQMALPQTGSVNTTGLVALGLSTLTLGMALGLKRKRD